MSIDALLKGPVRAVNVGLESFARDLAANRAAVVQVDWTPPLLPFDEKIEAANAEALRRILAAEPVLSDVRRAGELIPALDAKHLVLHAGPPIEWARMCGPLRGAVCGAIVFEGWAADLAAAEALAAGGEIEFAPNHHYGAVGPMTGITTRSMPLMVVENRAFAHLPNAWAACAINEGLGKVMRFGANDAEVLARLAWLRDEFGPLLGEALRAAPVPLNPLIARGLTMGDEMHQRNVACTSLLMRTLAPRMARSVKALEFIAGNDQFFLNVAMAMGKSILDPARGIVGSTIDTAMARNGTDFGIQVAGTGDEWFTGPAQLADGLFLGSYGPDDANPDIGDSAITETAGIGGFAMATAPAVAGFVGAGGFRDALATTRAMGEIAVARHPQWTIPALEFGG
ncbi:MAG TPA: DUF1116 domain-containing protein, partial [Burkholderiales bacterium]|nr:DUF1116 domain-containing protein [Burkholderiales bacterium]